MKIIGITKHGFIIEAHADEVANLTGYYSHYSNVDGFKSPAVGDTIQISKMYKQLYELKAMDGELSRIATTLRGFADHLETVQPIIRPKPEEAKLADAIPRSETKELHEIEAQLRGDR